MITAEQYLEIIKQRDYRILHGGNKEACMGLAKGRNDIRDILLDESKEFNCMTTTLAKTEDYLELEFGVKDLLRHFHVLVFWRNGEVAEILELSGRGESGNLLWNRCYTTEAGFSNSKWLDALISQHMMANPNLLLEGGKQ